MVIVGVIAEYNPFHNGHIYHLEKIKEMEPDSIIIAVITTTFGQRGTPSLLDKETKTKLCLDYGINLVLELPFPFATQGADIFAHGAISILDMLGVEKLYFGSECNDVDKLTSLANYSFKEEYQEKVKVYLNQGVNYPTALNLAFGQDSITTPNDLLGLSYIKEIIRTNSKMIPKTVLRTNSFHEKKIKDSITSATSIRKAIDEDKNFYGTVPAELYEKLKKMKGLNEKYFPFLKYKIITESNLALYQTVDEGLENRIKSVISISSSLEDFIQRMKTKRYTYNRLMRMCSHILCGFTKEKAIVFSDIQYIRVLGFNRCGQEYLNQVKKNLPVPLVSTLSKKKIPMLEYEKQILDIYLLPFPAEENLRLKQAEYEKFPIRKDEK